MSEDVRTIDLHHMGQAGAIGVHVLGDVVVDPGSEKTIERVIEDLGEQEPRAVLLTHIHFDHAGGTGALVERFPDLEVWVHERGARHLIDPTRLVASARRVFGEYFDTLWGHVLPVPERNVRVLTGGESIGDWEVAYAPGHAQHHVAYLHTPTATAFTGDVTGIRIDDGPAFPPTPPPDIDPPLWDRSLDVLEAWAPQRLAYSHYGTATDVPEHLAQFREALDEFTAAARGGDAIAMAAWIRSWLTERGVGEDAMQRYYWASPFEGMWGGLDRYERRQAEAGAGG